MTVVPLGDVAAVKSGFAFKSKDWRDTGVPVIKIANVKEGSVVVEGCSFVSEETASTAKAFELGKGDILISMTGYIGQVAKVRNEGRLLLNQRVGKFTIRDPRRLDSEYLFHWLRLPEVRASLAAHAHGAAQPNISPASIEQQPIPLPLLSTQRRIASILCAYDDLIENNTRRIAILEEMARRIYEEWFVRFRFPGHENVEMVESELGLVPDGWAVVRLDKILVLQRGFDLPTKARSDGPYRVIAATGEHGTHRESRVKGPGVVTGRSGSLGAVLYIEEDFWPLNTTLWVKEYVVGSPLFAFFVLRSIDLAGFNSGAAVPTLNRNDIHGLPVMRPTADVLSRFDEVVEPLMQLARTLKRKNSNLRTTRDLLLPKLISGELDVSALPDPEAVAA